MRETIKIKLKPTFKVFYNPSTNFGIYAFATKDNQKVKMNKRKGYTLRGTLPDLILDNEYVASLIETEDDRFGYTYEVVSIYEEIPTDKQKQKVFLSHILKPKQVDAIYKAYPDEDVIKLIQENKFDISKVKGIGKKSIIKIKDRIEQNTEYSEALEFMGQYEIDPKLTKKLVKHFGSSSLLIQKIKKSPYNMLEVKGIGFIKADAIAKKMNYPLEGDERILASIEHIVEQEELNGNTYITIRKLLKDVHELINVDYPLIEERLVDTKNVLMIDNRVTLKKTFNAEKNVARQLQSFLGNSTELDINIDEFIKEQEEKHDISLTDQQKSFFENIKKYSVNLLVGFAGCGKSQMQALLIDLLEELEMTYTLLSPTGKAAKVLSSYTNREVQTIHRAIGLRGSDEDSFKEIDSEFIVVDESSMLDIKLASTLLNRIKNENARLLFIGDSFQLPSVSAGLFLHDCIESGVIPTTKLDIVFRQKEGGILDICTKIRLGQRFVESDFIGIKEYGNNCVLASVPQEKMESGYKFYYNELLKKYSPDDIMVLSPTKKGKLGTFAVNNKIQSIVNPQDNSREEIKTLKENNEVFLREGDSIINTKNTYRIPLDEDTEVDLVNGDIGKIISIDNDESEITVKFDIGDIPLPLSKLDQLLHSWCITKHKSQGSSSKAVIAIADKSHTFQLTANILYTAFTRTKDYLVILSQAETLNKATKKVASVQRNTFLKEMLKGEL